MPASEGTPTILQKAVVAAEALFGHVPPDAVDQATLAGLKRDFSQAVADVENIFGPVLNEIEADAVKDVTGFLKGVLQAAPTFTSLAQAINFVKGSAASYGGPIGQQITNLSQGALMALVSAALVAAGHLNVPVA